MPYSNLALLLHLLFEILVVEIDEHAMKYMYVFLKWQYSVSKSCKHVVLYDQGGNIYYTVWLWETIIKAGRCHAYAL